jgi:hypothetical protein
VRKRVNPCTWGGLTGGACERAGKVADKSAPAVDAVTLVGEYTINSLLDAARRLGSGFELAGRGELARAEFFEALGPRVHACAADIACSLLVGMALSYLAAVTAPIPGPGQVFGALAAGWTMYVGYVQANNYGKTSSQADADSVCLARGSAIC